MSNDDLIRRGDVKTSVCKEESADTGCGDGCDGNCYYMTVINRILAVDAVEVVRCKDCRKNPKIAWVECPMAGKSQVFDEGYCHLGERREKNNADAI